MKAVQAHSLTGFVANPRDSRQQVIDSAHKYLLRTGWAFKATTGQLAAGAKKLADVAIAANWKALASAERGF